MQGPLEACGVVGVYAPGLPAARLTYRALGILQHRGEESAGIAVGDGTRVTCHRGLGLVSDVFSGDRLDQLPGHAAIGHTRYSTSGPPTFANAQPAVDPQGRFAVAHNGQVIAPPEAATDSHHIVSLLEGDDLPATAERALPSLRGAFSLVLLDRWRLLAARDPYGIRPLTLGRLPAVGWVVASETAAISAIGGEVVRDVEPGELLIVDVAGVRSLRWADPHPRSCLFEFVYLARPDSVLDGRSVYEARYEAGRLLAGEAPPPADVVIGVPDSGIPAALGYAQASALPYNHGFVRSPYIGRTFIQPVQGTRVEDVRLKLTPIAAVVRGRRVIVVDDSIVRGNTQRLVVESLQAAGAAEVHLRIASPPVRWPCFYGFDFATRDQLIAAGRTVGEIRTLLGVDSLAYLSLAGLVAAIGRDRGRLCRACMDGCYPIPGASGPCVLEGTTQR